MADNLDPEAARQLVYAVFRADSILSADLVDRLLETVVLDLLFGRLASDVDALILGRRVQTLLQVQQARAASERWGPARLVLAA